MPCVCLVCESGCAVERCCEVVSLKWSVWQAPTWPFFQLLTQQPTWVLHRHGKLDSSQPEQEKSASMYINSKCIRYLIHYMKMGQSWGSLSFPGPDQLKRFARVGRWNKKSVLLPCHTLGALMSSCLYPGRAKDTNIKQFHKADKELKKNSAIPLAL